MIKAAKVALCIPTLNAERMLPALVTSLHQQSMSPGDVLVIDSNSHDGTVNWALRAGMRVHKLSANSFDHGGTRQMAVGLLLDSEILVFLTQDAILEVEQSLATLVACFADSTVGAAYGRQLPKPGAGPVEAHARFFNYPEQSRVKGLADVPELGIKTAFISNSFAAYRRTALEQVGGFPSKTILGEDTCVAARMILSGWKVAYCAEAKVYHSHSYRFIEEFRRYFDIGVLHSRERWILTELGKAEGEGMRFVRSELSYLLHYGPQHIPSALFRLLLKYVAYILGGLEGYLPFIIKCNLSMNRGFWMINKT